MSGIIIEIWSFLHSSCSPSLCAPELSSSFSGPQFPPCADCSAHEQYSSVKLGGINTAPSPTMDRAGHDKSSGCPDAGSPVQPGTTLTWKSWADGGWTEHPPSGGVCGVQREKGDLGLGVQWGSPPLHGGTLQD